MEAIIQNYAPDQDCIKVSIGEWIITVDRDEQGEVSVVEGSATILTLGHEDETQRQRV
jgi:hypothetical protein